MLARTAPMPIKELSHAGREMGETKVPKRAATGGSVKAISMSCGMSRSTETTSRMTEVTLIARLSAGCVRARFARRPSAEA